MAEQRLQAELAESKMEIQRLRERLSIAMPTVHKDLSLISLVPKWSGLESGVPLEEFFSSIEGSALIGRWEQSDMIRIAVLKLTGAAKLFYNGCPELHAEDVTWSSFKSALTQRFRDTHSDQFHFMQLQTARQKKNESVREFADRCKGLAQKVMCKVDDPAAQRIHRENADRMLLASFVGGLWGIPGKQTRYASPRLLNMRCRLPLQFRKQKIKRNLMKPFIQGLMTQFGSYRDHPVGHVEKAVALGAQLTRRRSITRVISATGLHVALTSHQIQEPGMSRQKRLSGVTNVTAWAIMLENAPPG